MAFNDQALKSIFDNANDFFTQRDERRQQQELIILKSLLENDNIEPVIEQGSSSNLEQAMGLTAAPRFSFRRRAGGNIEEQKLQLDKDKFAFEKDKQGFAEEKELNDSMEKLLDQARQNTSSALGNDLLRIKDKQGTEAFKAEYNSQVETLLKGQLETINPKYREKFKASVYAQLGKKMEQVDSDGVESLGKNSGGTLTPTEQLLKVLNDMPNRDEAVRILEAAQNDPDSVESNRDIDFGYIKQALQLPKKNVTQSDTDSDLTPRGDNPLMTENLPRKKKGFTEDKGDFKLTETQRQELKKKGAIIMDRNKLRRPLSPIERSILMSKEDPDDLASFSEGELNTLANEAFKQSMFSGGPSMMTQQRPQQMAPIDPTIIKLLMDSQQFGALRAAPGKTDKKKRPYTHSNF